MNSSRISNLNFNLAPAKSWKIEYNFKWNQPYVSRGSNSLNSASDQGFEVVHQAFPSLNGGSLEVMLTAPLNDVKYGSHP